MSSSVGVVESIAICTLVLSTADRIDIVSITSKRCQLIAVVASSWRLFFLILVYQ
jgi:hypothetical protein